MKLTYWMAECLNDSAAYSIRRKTKRAVVEALRTEVYAGNYGKPKKVTVEYVDAFDLLGQCLGEGGGYWEV